MSNETFSIGEVAFHILWKCEVTITSELKYGRSRSATTGEVTLGSVHLVDRHDGKPTPCLNPQWVASPSNLRKIKPPREDLQTVRWADCPWQPARLEVL